MLDRVVVGRVWAGAAVDSELDREGALLRWGACGTVFLVLACGAVFLVLACVAVFLVLGATLGAVLTSCIVLSAGRFLPPRPPPPFLPLAPLLLLFPAPPLSLEETLCLEPPCPVLLSPGARLEKAGGGP